MVEPGLPNRSGIRQSWKGKAARLGRLATVLGYLLQPCAYARWYIEIGVNLPVGGRVCYSSRSKRPESVGFDEVPWESGGLRPQPCGQREGSVGGK
ncbi:uncharacterized protein BDZ99DRAFT_208646 [Mytilinidion resinicola]|uniref:Uncharacterized protein n=1 Tax=Mytilinidion resinicola TaxID=574789 RepID=A0A6A6Y081_9PEZI|nr:uncharacterized protein BDZ99DRAFT_208646 [Mytilinidion resinicola]KAF2802060.1 hypothetical protein BDZ99DRAFT_208646 [Mytilinidion resinicola]